MPKTVLEGLKRYPVKLSVICAMLDSGGSSGRLRKDYNIVSPGDLRRALIALSNTSPTFNNLLKFRFDAGALRGHNFANILITALILSTGSYEKAIEETRKILNVKERVFPATLDNSNVCAVLENGKIITGETNIDIPKHNGNLKIKKVFLKPKARAYPEALKAIKNADLIVIGPGDLYSSLAQILLTEKISEAIGKSRAKKAYICNLMQKNGETNDFTVFDFASKIEDILGEKLDYVIYNNRLPSPKQLKQHKKKNPELLGLTKINTNLSGEKFIGKNLLKGNTPEHSPEKIAKILMSLLKRIPRHSV